MARISSNTKMTLNSPKSVNGYTKVQNFSWLSYSQALMSTPELKPKCPRHLLTIKMVVHIKLPRTNRQEESSVTC